MSKIKQLMKTIKLKISRLVANLGVGFFLHTNFLHQILFENYDLQIHYPSPYGREIWYLQEPDAILSDAQFTNLEGNEPLQIQYQLPRYCFKYDCQKRSKNIMKP